MQKTFISLFVFLILTCVLIPDCLRTSEHEDMSSPVESKVTGLTWH